MSLRFCGQFLILILVTGIVYSPTFQADFILDDGKFYLNDPVMENPQGWHTIWFSPRENNHIWPYLPITRSSFWLERQLFGLQLPVTHALNVALHALAALLLWLGLRRFQLPGAWLAALLFALHPIHVQSVAWIAERKNVMAGVFYILTLWSYWHFAQKQDWRWYSAALLLFIGALLSKTSTIMLPILLGVGYLWLRIPLNRKVLFGLLPFLGLSLGAGILRIWFELTSFGADDTIYNLPIAERLLVAANVPFFYLRKLLLPYPLMFHYPKWTLEISELSQWIPLLSWMGIGGFLLYQYRRWTRGLCLTIAAFVITLFPVLGLFKNAFTQYSFVADHWVHLASLPIFLAVAWAATKGGEQIVIGGTRSGKVGGKNIPTIILGMGLCVLAVLTWKQAMIYQDRPTFWKATLERNPQSWLAYYNLGEFYLNDAQYTEAIDQFDQALSIEPTLFQAYDNRGNAHLLLKNYSEAIANYDQALGLKPNYSKTYNNRANAHFRLGHHDQALEDFTEALRLNPQAQIYISRAFVHNHLKQYPLACQDLHAACQLGQCDFLRQAQQRNFCQ